MLFNSLDFLVFFPVVCATYFLLPPRYRWMQLLVASCYFYMSFIPVFILVLAALILLDWTVGISLERVRGHRRRVLLALSLMGNLGLLFTFKYFNFANENVAALAHLLHWNYSIHALSLALPIGLSFHTFQSLSYIIEVYRGEQKAERHLGIYALYVLFFPQLVAGPIERPQHLLHQFREDHAFDARQVSSGLRLMAWGMFQKLVIADTAGVFVDRVFSAPQKQGGLALLLAMLLFSFQLYGYFAGYSDIARGAARVLGFRLVQNFDRPYASRSVAEFWRRWHISLSAWLRDYVYYPVLLLAKQPGVGAVCASLFVTMLLSGLWHGAGWTFVAMGALHGVYLDLGTVTRRVRERMASALGVARVPRLQAVVQTAVTFCLVSVGWMFFRAASISDASYILRHLWSPGPALPTQVLDAFQWTSLCLALGVLLCREWVPNLEEHWRGFTVQRPGLRFAFDYGLVTWTLFFGYFSGSPFIYFQF